MSRVLNKCKQILATQRKSDNESLRRLVISISREMKVKVTESEITHAVYFLKYGCAIW